MQCQNFKDENNKRKEKNIIKTFQDAAFESIGITNSEVVRILDILIRYGSYNTGTLFIDFKQGTNFDEYINWKQEVQYESCKEEY